MEQEIGEGQPRRPRVRMKVRDDDLVLVVAATTAPITVTLATPGCSKKGETHASC